MNDFLASSSKAIAGFAVTAILAYLAKHGFNGDLSLSAFVDAVVNGLVGFAIVWLAPKNKTL